MKKTQTCADHPTLYLVEIYGGQWEDSWDYALAGSTDKSVAQNFLLEHQAKVQAWRDREEEFSIQVEKWLEKYKESNPEPKKEAKYYDWVAIVEPLEMEFKKELAQKMNLDLECWQHVQDDLNYRITEVPNIMYINSEDK